MAYLDPITPDLFNGTQMPAVSPQMYDQQFGGQQPNAYPPNTNMPTVTLADIAKQYQQNQQQPQNDLANQILSARFQPTQGDVAQAGINTAMSFAPDSKFAPTTPEQIAQQRVQTQFAPYTTLLDYGIKERQGMPDFTKMAQMAFMKQASGEPMTLQDQAAVNAWRNMGQNGVMFDPNTGNMIQTNTRMPGGMAAAGNLPQPGNIMGQSNSTQDIGGNNNVNSTLSNASSPSTANMTPKTRAEFDKKRAEGLADASITSSDADSTVNNLISAIDDAKKASDQIPGGAAQAIGNYAGKSFPTFSNINKNSVLYHQAIGSTILSGIQTLKGLGRLDIPEINQVIKTYGIGIDNSPEARSAGLDALKTKILNDYATSKNKFTNMNNFDVNQTQITPMANSSQDNIQPVTNWVIKDGQLVQQ